MLDIIYVIKSDGGRELHSNVDSQCLAYLWRTFDFKAVHNVIRADCSPDSAAAAEGLVRRMDTWARCHSVAGSVGPD